MTRPPMVFLSRFTVGAKGDEVSFSIGDVVQYRCLNGDIVDFTIKSQPMVNKLCPTWGYEALAHDDGQMTFIESKRIINWEK